jgi:hypothetical protein
MREIDTSEGPVTVIVGGIVFIVTAMVSFAVATIRQRLWRKHNQRGKCA